MEEVKRNSLRAWILAARPKTLTGAITPVMIGSALAYMDGHFQWLPALVCCLFASLMQIAANFINDLFDYLKGTGTSLCTRLDFTESHAKRNHHHRTICLSDRLFAVVLCRMGANHSRTSLRAIRFPLYHRALSIVLQRLGRYSGHRLFRIRPRRRNVLRTSLDMDDRHHNRFFNMWAAD